MYQKDVYDKQDKMNTPILIAHPLLKIANRALIDFPTPTNIRAR
jgi:hypothetical protein